MEKYILKKYVKKNRHRIIDTNPYDLLINIQNKILPQRCIIEIITSKHHDCLFDENDNIRCDTCIQKWLNSPIE